MVGRQRGVFKPLKHTDKKSHLDKTAGKSEGKGAMGWVWGASGVMELTEPVDMGNKPLALDKHSGRGSGGQFSVDQHRQYHAQQRRSI